MIKLYGPKVPRYSFGKDEKTGKMVSFELDGFNVNAKTLGEALKLYEEKYNIKITPYESQIAEIQLDPNDEPKYFWFEDVEFPERSCVVDVHILRFDDDMCVKQKLNFPLNNGDIISIGPLSC